MRRTMVGALSLVWLVSWTLASPAAQVGTEQNPRPWVGRHEEIEAFIKTARIERVESVPIGVTRPRRAYFAPGSLVESVALKNLRPSRQTGYFESYQSEIAAYELDKLLDLGMVPPTVERQYEGMGSAQLWVNDTVYRKTLREQNQQPPNQAEWNRQINRWWVFDNLIANIDRNDGNLLVLRTPNWHLVLIDHSRAFTSATKMVFKMAQIDRPLFERLKALDKATLDDRIGKLVQDGSRSLLRRRDAIVAHFEKLAQSQGESSVFTP